MVPNTGFQAVTVCETTAPPTFMGSLATIFSASSAESTFAISRAPVATSPSSRGPETIRLHLNLGGQVLAVSRTVLGLLLGCGVNVGNCVVSHGDFLRAKTRGERGGPRFCFGALHTRTV